MTILFGIKNCDSVKKARAWLDSHQLPYTFSDFRIEGIDPQRLQVWVAEAGWKLLLNRRSSSWRQLPEAVRLDIDERSALSLMVENPTLIKRPVVEHHGQVVIGFSETTFTRLFIVH